MFAKVPKSGARWQLRFPCRTGGQLFPAGARGVRGGAERWQGAWALQLKGSGFPGPPVTSSTILHRLFEVTSWVPTGKWSYSWSRPHGAGGKTTRETVDCSETDPSAGGR